MTHRRRKMWLKTLTKPQLMALASQRKVADWKSLSTRELVQVLVEFEDIDKAAPA